MRKCFAVSELCPHTGQLEGIGQSLYAHLKEHTEKLAPLSRATGLSTETLWKGNCAADDWSHQPQAVWPIYRPHDTPWIIVDKHNTPYRNIKQVTRDIESVRRAKRPDIKQMRELAKTSLPYEPELPETKTIHTQTVLKTTQKVLWNKLPTSQYLSKEQKRFPDGFKTNQTISPICPVCQQTEESTSHFLSCPRLPDIPSQLCDILTPHIPFRTFSTLNLDHIILGFLPKQVFRDVATFRKIQWDIASLLHERWKKRCALLGIFLSTISNQNQLQQQPP